MQESELKIHALSRVAKHMNMDKLRILMKSFIDSQFANFSLVWIFTAGLHIAE